MGIVYSTLAPTAVRLAYICQKLFDPKYSCIEDAQSSSNGSQQPAATAEVSPSSTATELLQVQSTSLVTLAKVELQPAAMQESNALVLPASLQTRIHAVKSNSLPRYSNAKSPDYNYYSLHQQNRARRARQLRYHKTRPSSFDGQLIIRAKTKNAVIVTSTPSRHWDAVTSSSSGCSSDSNSNSDSDSETELRVSANASNEEIGCSKLAMTAEDEEDFRLTLGRGHFSKSKKDRFLNNLRLQKASTAAASLW